MKAVRTYQMFRGKFSCTTEFFSDQSDEVDQVFESLHPEGAMVISEWIDRKGEYHFEVIAPPDFDPKVVHGEISYFLQTLKQMYQL